MSTPGNQASETIN